MTTGRRPRKPMIPSLTERDRAAIETTVKQSGLTSGQSDDSKPAPHKTSKPDAAASDASTLKETPQPKTRPEKPEQTGSAVPGHDKKALRVSVAPSSELADAIRAKIQALSPDAQKFVTTATLLREFLNEHDARLAKLFRDKHGL